ncbi:unnamed protein product [Vitrella brassicaformis CCMP3155]|uniref:Uncharacterized protein n=1 Tax=Vitrella brassicaformis (strain CCMP3155) TaxID=1169540 RepID=A0A0G4GCD8_VITBC|nr:unnamed protein product [Vitrella brassicaformis CCMP3155]|eukprot:CEM26932.1 unnamed protein product [Vitrella brassicaformis CCMP3155]
MDDAVEEVQPQPQPQGRQPQGHDGAGGGGQQQQPPPPPPPGCVLQKTHGQKTHGQYMELLKDILPVEPMLVFFCQHRDADWQYIFRDVVKKGCQGSAHPKQRPVEKDCSLWLLPGQFRVTIPLDNDRISRLNAHRWAKMAVVCEKIRLIAIRWDKWLLLKALSSNKKIITVTHKHVEKLFEKYEKQQVGAMPLAVLEYELLALAGLGAPLHSITWSYPNGGWAEPTIDAINFATGRLHVPTIRLANRHDNQPDSEQIDPHLTVSYLNQPIQLRFSDAALINQLHRKAPNPMRLSVRIAADGTPADVQAAKDMLANWQGGLGGQLAGVHRCGVQEPNTPPQRPPSEYFVLCLAPFIAVTVTDTTADDGFDAEVRMVGEAVSRCRVGSLADLNRVLDGQHSDKYAGYIRRIREAAALPGLTVTVTTNHKYLNMNLH